MIAYHFRWPDGTERRFEVDPDRPQTADGPDWTELEYFQCANCPLSPAESPRCPPAADLVAIVSAFNDADSTDRAEVRVVTPQREYARTCDLQTALRSLIGVVMATSACPILGRLRGMARFHLPFADRAETVSRVVSAYLIKQYFAALDGDTPDMALAGLRQLYEELKEVNMAFAGRLRAPAARDANINAVASLSGLTHLVSYSLDDDLLELRRVFGAAPGDGADSGGV